MDQLTRDCIAARKAGMNYGQWKALQTPTKVTPPKPEGFKFKCEMCGAVFYKPDKKPRKWCSDNCRERAYKERKKGLRVCQICGKQFNPKTTHRTKYCSAECGEAGQARNVKAWEQKYRRNK